MNIVTGTVTNRRDHMSARMIVKRVMITVAVIFVATLALGIAVNAARGDWTGQNKPLPACEQEDDRGCYWDAETQGNGKGKDVVTP